MSELLARLARTLTHRWKISGRRRLLRDRSHRHRRRCRREAADDFSAPGTETQKAIDLFKAHSPAFAGADSTLVFNVDEGKITDPGPKAAVEGALAKVKTLDGRRRGRRPVRRGRNHLAGRPARLGRRALQHRPEPIKKADGEALIAAGELARRTASSSPPAAC